jgi:protein-tyrosine phosphatase
MIEDADSSVPLTRHLAWEGCYNVRDLGGLPTRKGTLTRRGAVIRADLLARLTPTGRSAMFDYGVRTVIDLRAPQETIDEPSVARVGDHPLTYLNLPLEAYYPHVSALIQQAQSRAQVYCIMVDHYADLMVEVMRAVADAGSGGIVIHCHAGKDRTGIVSALLLALAGVSAADIAVDYAESQARLWPLYEAMVAKAGGEEQVGFWYKPTATPDMMVAFLAHMEARHGGVETYLRAAGLSSDKLERIQQRLHTPIT